MSNVIEPSGKVHEYTDFASPIDLVAAGGVPAHYLKVITGNGTVTIKDGTGTSEPLTMAEGETLDAVFVREITSAPGVSRIRVQWPPKFGRTSA